MSGPKGRLDDGKCPQLKRDSNRPQPTEYKALPAGHLFPPTGPDSSGSAQSSGIRPGAIGVGIGIGIGVGLSASPPPGSLQLAALAVRDDRVKGSLFGMTE